ncbi:MAG: hypothetical protein K2Z81_14720 [Cyanobacteria bacterium]|nr:hypothetical protein [Cyanobacteriota bacterium]
MRRHARRHKHPPESSLSTQHRSTAAPPDNNVALDEAARRSQWNVPGVEKDSLAHGKNSIQTAPQQLNGVQSTTSGLTGPKSPAHWARRLDQAGLSSERGYGLPESGRHNSYHTEPGSQASSTIWIIAAIGVVAFFWVVMNPKDTLSFVVLAACVALSMYRFGIIESKSNPASKFRIPHFCSLIVITGVVSPLVVVVWSLFFSWNLITQMAAYDPLGLLRHAVFLAIIPIANFIVWNSLEKEIVSPRTNGLLIGLALGSTGCWLAGFLVSSLQGNSIATGLSMTFALLLLWSALVLRKKLLRQREAVSAIARKNVGLGIMLAILCLFVPELRASTIAVASKLALAPDAIASKIGFETLRVLRAEDDVMSLSAAPSRPAAIIPQLVFPTSDTEGQELYFRLTGCMPKPQNQTKVSAELLKNPGVDAGFIGDKVGAAVPGLTISNTLLSGIVDSQSLTTVLYWTYDFKNMTSKPQEARAQILLPHGGTVSRVTSWINGKPEEAAFNARELTRQAYQSVAAGRCEPVLVSKTGDDRVLLQAFPVPPHQKMKVRIGITAPLSMTSRKDGHITMPQIVESNFSTDNIYDVHIQSADRMSATTGGARLSENGDGQFILKANVKHEDLDNFTVNVRRHNEFKTFAVGATHSSDTSYIAETVDGVESEPPTNIAVVIDGSSSMEENIRHIKPALEKIPSTTKVSVLFADNDSMDKNAFVDQPSTRAAMNEIAKRQFKGGHDNVSALVQALEIVGNDPGSAIVWIHGPQPGLSGQSKEALVLLSQMQSRLTRFYDVATTSGVNRIADHLSTISNLENRPQLRPVPRTGALSTDLTRFFSNLYGPRTLRVMLTKTTSRPHGPVSYEHPIASRLSTLWAYNQAQSLALEGKIYESQTLGSTYRIVSDVTSAVVLERQTDYNRFNLRRNLWEKVSSSSGNSGSGVAVASMPDVASDRFAQTLAPGNPVSVTVNWLEASTRDANLFDGAPTLAGATNGTIGPQSVDATIIRGVNTAGTVRANFLANMEASINVTSGILMMLGLIWGFPMLIAGLCGAYPSRKAARKAFVCGSAIVFAAFFTPTTVQLILVLARSANLFN